MPSSYSASLRFELQFTGENVNTWGVRLNTLFNRADFSIAGLAPIELSGAPYTLTASNTADDQSRAAILKFTGIGGGTVTIPSVSKTYTVWNANAGVVVLTAGGATVSIDPGDVVKVFCDGTDVRPAVGYADSGGNLLSLKDYIAAQVFASSTGPAVTGNAGKFRTNNGFVESWQFITIANVTDYASDQAAKITAARGEAIAFAVAL